MVPDGPAPHKAIVCEDQPLTSAALAQLCEALGYEVVARPQNGLEAVEAAATHKPDLVLMDLKMPGIDGIEAARRIQALRPTTIVVITGHVNEEFVEGAAEAGVAGYLLKPVSLEQLHSTVGVATSNVERLHKAIAEAEAARRDLANRKVIERAKGYLMEDQGLTEHEAYRVLQKRSQDERRPMAELAQEVIQRHEEPNEGPAETEAPR
jgi:response regulator NasT